MLREQCKVGMTVTFGRVAGEKTVGVVVKCNPSKAKVRINEARGRTPAGAVWNVPYSLLTSDEVTSPKPAHPVGLNITRVRSLTKQELDQEGWSGSGLVIELSDGSLLYPSQAYEGNGPGVLFGKTNTGTLFALKPS